MLEDGTEDGRSNPEQRPPGFEEVLPRRADESDDSYQFHMSDYELEMFRTGGIGMDRGTGSHVTEVVTPTEDGATANPESLFTFTDHRQPQEPSTSTKADDIVTSGLHKELADQNRAYLQQSRELMAQEERIAELEKTLCELIKDKCNTGETEQHFDGERQSSEETRVHPRENFNPDELVNFGPRSTTKSVKSKI